MFRSAEFNLFRAPLRGGRRAPKTGLRSKTKEISSPRDYFFRYQKVFRHLGRKYKSVGSGSSEKRECGKLCRRSGHSFENFSAFPHWRSQSFWLWVFGVLSCPSPGLYSRQSPYGLRVSGIQGPTLSTPMDSHIPAGRSRQHYVGNSVVFPILKVTDASPCATVLEK